MQRLCQFHTFFTSFTKSCKINLNPTNTNYVKLRQTVINPSTRLFSQTPLNVNTNVIKDVILFKYENPKFFKMLNVFALCQFGFWTYLSHFAYTTLRDVPMPKSEELSWWRKINLGEQKYRMTLTVIAFLAGYGILTISWMYTLRSVRYLVLHKGGKKVSFVTYGPFGNNRILTVGLENVSCKEMRSAATVQLPVKVRNQYLHYILDMRGEFKNPMLFDHTAGLKRRFRDL